jgi:hypothetical protein
LNLGVSGQIYPDSHQRRTTRNELFESLGYLKCSPYTGTPGAQTVTKRVLACII